MPDTPKNAESDILKAVAAKSLADLAEELHPLYHLEALADYLGSLASALDSLADMSALRVIAEHGSAEDRGRALELLKGRFDAFREY